MSHLKICPFCCFPTYRKEVHRDWCCTKKSALPSIAAIVTATVLGIAIYSASLHLARLAPTAPTSGEGDAR